VLVIRTPGEQLEHRGLIEREAKKKIEDATEKTVTAGYSVGLLPEKEDQQLRKDARRTQNILGKLTLNLPCFGLWMPSAYWDIFQEAVAEVQATGIPTDAIRAAAAQRRRELDGAGIERQVDAIIADLKRGGLAVPGREADLRAELLSHFRAQLVHRTPEVVARAVGFRTQRQALASDLDLRTVARARSSSIWCNRRSPRPTARESGPDASARSWGASSPHGSPNAAWRSVRSQAMPSPFGSSTAPPGGRTRASASRR